MYRRGRPYIDPMTDLKKLPEPRDPRAGASVASLLVANGLAIAMTVLEGWDLRELMIIYWSQSVIIGYFSFRRMRDLKEFSTVGVKMNDRSVEPTAATKRSMSIFFLLHFGFFHLTYFIFIFAEERISLREDFILIGICIVAFLINHWYSYVEYREMDATRKPNIGTIMLFPYARILPMHLTIIAGGIVSQGSTPLLLLFLGLKTAADVVMHQIEHRAWRK
jgi:hypothetical protein